MNDIHIRSRKQRYHLYTMVDCINWKRDRGKILSEMSSFGMIDRIMI